MINPKASYTKILQKCIKIANERQSQYGEASDNIQEASDMLDNLFGIKLSVSEICKVMIALKFSREKYKHKADNIVDIVNYLCISLNQK